MMPVTGGGSPCSVDGWTWRVPSPWSQFHVPLDSCKKTKIGLMFWCCVWVCARLFALCLSLEATVSCDESVLQSHYLYFCLQSRSAPPPNSSMVNVLKPDTMTLGDKSCFCFVCRDLGGAWGRVHNPCLESQLLALLIHHNEVNIYIFQRCAVMA